MRKETAAICTSLFFAVGPGLLAGLVPWLLTGWQTGSHVPYGMPLRVLGGALVVVSTPVLIHAFARFVMEGVGTPIPSAAPRNLVVGGLYRHVRNPMYIAVSATIVGQALVLERFDLLLWAAVVTGAFAAFVRYYEGPTLRRRFGQQYEQYRSAVPGWVPRLRPWHPA